MYGGVWSVGCGGSGDSAMERRCGDVEMWRLPGSCRKCGSCGSFAEVARKKKECVKMLKKDFFMKKITIRFDCDFSNDQKIFIGDFSIRSDNLR